MDAMDAMENPEGREIELFFSPSDIASFASFAVLNLGVLSLLPFQIRGCPTGSFVLIVSALTPKYIQTHVSIYG